ncbi:MAG: hypothetical protein Tsb009_00730 [Planctomycetaceae bacterium]
MTVRKTIKWCLAIILLIVAAGAGYGYWLWSNANQLLLEKVRAELAQRAPGWEIEVGSARFDWSRRIHLYDVTLRVKEDAHPLARIPEIILVVDRDKLADDQEIIVHQVHLINPEFSLVRFEQGDWNWQKLPPLPKSEKKPSLPEIVIREARFLVELKQSQGILPARMQLHSAKARFVPSARRSYTIQATTDIGESGTLSVEGNWNIDSKTWSLAGKIEQITSSGELLGLAVGTSPELRSQIARLEKALRKITPPEELPPTPINSDALPDFGASGTLDVTFDFTRENPQQEPRFGLLAEIHRASLTNPALPFPLHNITGKIRWNNNQVVAENLRAQNGLTQITISGGIRRENQATPCRFDVAIHQLPLDNRLRKRLPPSWRKIYDRLQPTGHVDLTGVIRFDGIRTWTPSGFVLTFRDCTGAHVEFPYRVRKINGTVTQRQNVFDINLTGIAGGKPATLHGYVKNPGPSSESLFDMSVKNFPIDDTFLSACKPELRKTIRSFGLKGLTDAHYRISKSSPRERKFRHQIVADVKNASIEYEHFPYRMKNFSGRLRFDSRDEVWHFQNLIANNGQTTFQGAGRLSKIDGRQFLRLRVVTKKGNFDNELRRALPPNLESAWVDLSPTGKLDLTTDLTWSTGQPVDVTLSNVVVTNGSMLLKSFPLPLNNIQAKLSYANGRVEIHSFRAKNEEMLVRIKYGYLDCLPDGEWKLRLEQFFADDITPDRRFRRALGKDLRTVVEELNPRGKMSVSGMLELWGTGRPRDPVTAAWQLKFLLAGNALNVGVPLKNVYGHVTARGRWDGRRVEMLTGNSIALDSVSLWGYQFTNLRGPYKIVGKQIIVGSAAALPVRPRTTPLRPIPLSERITAQAIGGDFTLDAILLLEKETTYQVSLTMRKARLEQFARRYLRGVKNLAGVMYGRLNLYGRGNSPRKITGQGKLLISPAALYELPVLATVFQVIQFVPPDKTAFKFAFADFQIANQQFLFRLIDLVGDSISLRGRGSAHFNGKVALDFYSMMPRNQVPIPILNQLVSTATNAWVGVEVRGTVRHPIPRVKAVPQLDNALKRFLRAFGTRPIYPVPQVPPQYRSPAAKPNPGRRPAPRNPQVSRPRRNFRR